MGSNLSSLTSWLCGFGKMTVSLSLSLSSKREI